MSVSQEVQPTHVLEIKDVFRLSGRGAVVLGIMLTGQVQVGDYLEILDGKQMFLCSGIELVQKPPRVEGLVALVVRTLDQEPADPELFEKGGFLNITPKPRSSDSS